MEGVVRNEDAQSEKRKQIIDVAQSRFAQYGFEKTTMQEIANDMQMSKGSLYYYFPDKEALYRSIIEREKDEFLETIRAKIEQLSDPDEMLHQYMVTRLEMTERLINLSRMKSMYQKNLQGFMNDAVKDFNQLEDELIADILQLGVEKGQFQIEDLRATAALFNGLVRGLRIIYLRSKHVFQKEEDKSAHLDQVKLFLDIFCKGLRVAE
ncbi:TetR/AcrR family transcriptional regulator [Mangrovibacterium lignilyticum]|uniref:TetR/AcrR family transcriptional regulator n=1 Tax=Mangrovibacterium lignilyticum TaxID=2668052 RepID=UPI0013D364F3|nr:TetR/AcrR family transcriptional regulator [Mangrovibacterium lignilyticum]